MSPTNPNRMPLDAYVVPVFEPGAGRRLALMRMKRLLDQAELGAKFGVSQQTISKIERGAQYLCDQITLERFRDVFEKDIHYILRGTGEERYSVQMIGERYHEFKWVINRKKGGKKPGLKGVIIDSLTPTKKV